MMELRTKSTKHVVDLEEQVNKNELQEYIGELCVKLRNTEGED